MVMEQQAKILIVDDNIGLCQTMALILRRQGYVVATASQGLEAIEEVRQQPFDFIFMDIKMPLMNGVETYRKIKAVRPGATVFMMTAYAVEDLIQQALQEGAYGILYKPLDPEKVLALIAEAQAARQGIFILIVDDDPATCLTLKAILDRKGCQVGIAHSGEEAIAMAREAAYDLIFIDVKLPALDGLETYLAIKAVRPDVVTVMMTAYRQEVADLVDEALKNHAYTCLYKPLDMGRLLQLVDELWARKRQA
jgi:two-component system response regulator HydG